MSQQAIQNVLISSFGNNYISTADICFSIAGYVPMELFYLPQDMLAIIMDFVPYYQKYILNKSYYYQYHHFVNFKPQDAYIRNIIRSDLWFVFNHLKNTHITKWTKKKKFMYKKIKCDSYVSLLNKWCIESHSDKCRNILRDS